MAVLRDLAILDTPAEPAYDDIARLASACCHSAIAAVNFVDDERHWTKAAVGVEDGQGQSVPAGVSFCAATVSTEEGLLSIPDTAKAEDWRSHPLVKGAPHVGFYAGASVMVSGQPVGVVCVYGDEPRRLSADEEQALVALARQTSSHLELRKHNAELRDLAITDSLTGLANRTLLFDHLEIAVARNERDGSRVGVLFCDVDGLKQVNDSWGHEVGDRLLREVAGRLSAASRDTDTVARLAGDEFVIVCPGLESQQELDAIVDRIHTSHRAPAGGDPGLPAPCLSIGAALLRDGESALDVLRRADEAMYEIKAGRSDPAAA